MFSIPQLLRVAIDMPDSKSTETTEMSMRICLKQARLGILSTKSGKTRAKKLIVITIGSRVSNVTEKFNGPIERVIISSASNDRSFRDKRKIWHKL